MIFRRHTRLTLYVERMAVACIILIVATAFYSNAKAFIDLAQDNAARYQLKVMESMWMQQAVQEGTEEMILYEPLVQSGPFYELIVNLNPLQLAAALLQFNYL